MSEAGDGMEGWLKNATIESILDRCLADIAFETEDGRNAAKIIAAIRLQSELSNLHRIYLERAIRAGTPRSEILKINEYILALRRKDKKRTEDMIEASVTFALRLLSHLGVISVPKQQAPPLQKHRSRLSYLLKLLVEALSEPQTLGLVFRLAAGIMLTALAALGFNYVG